MIKQARLGSVVCAPGYDADEGENRNEVRAPPYWTLGGPYSAARETCPQHASMLRRCGCWIAHGGVGHDQHGGGQQHRDRGGGQENPMNSVVEHIHRNGGGSRGHVPTNPPAVIYAPQIGDQFNGGPPRPRPQRKIPN